MKFLTPKNCKEITNVKELDINDKTIYLEVDSYVEGCGVMLSVSRVTGDEVINLIEGCFKNNDKVFICDDGVISISNNDVTAAILIIPTEVVSKFLIGVDNG